MIVKITQDEVVIAEADQLEQPHVVEVLCPECKTENAFKVTVTDYGSAPDEWGTCHWFYGNGRCGACGYEGDYTDSNH